MSEYFPKFLDTADFAARWCCGNWSEFLGWLHIVSDVATFAAYFTIPIVLVYFARKRSDFPFTKLFWLFAGFILACGTVPLIEALIFWHPIYRVSGMMKFVTAVVSWATVAALIRYIPQVSWERYIGQSWGEHKGFGWANVIYEEDRPILRRRWHTALESGNKYQATRRSWNQETKSHHAFVAEAVPIRSVDGSIRESVGTVSDIEEQFQAEANLGILQTELAKQTRELELIYQAAPVGMCLIDREYRFLRINETLAKINGFTRGQHIG